MFLLTFKVTALSFGTLESSSNVTPWWSPGYGDSVLYPKYAYCPADSLELDELTDDELELLDNELELLDNELELDNELLELDNELLELDTEIELEDELELLDSELELDDENKLDDDDEIDEDEILGQETSVVLIPKYCVTFESPKFSSRKNIFPVLSSYSAPKCGPLPTGNDPTEPRGDNNDNTVTSV